MAIASIFLLSLLLAYIVCMSRVKKLNARQTGLAADTANPRSNPMKA